MYLYPSPHRKLLEGEESRYCTFSDAQIPVPYVYRQSPIYTLPSVPRVGGVTRKAEPQYKFVEEIITETTREDIEISDTGSDYAEQEGEDEKVCSKKEGGGVATGTDAHLEEKKTHESDAEDNTGSPNAENVEQADVSVHIKVGDMNTKLAQSKLSASEQTGEKDTDNNYNKGNDTDSKSQEPDSGTKTEKAQADVSGNEGVEIVALDTDKGKRDEVKEIDQACTQQLKPTEQTAIQEEAEKSAVEEISSKSEKEKAKKETQHVSEAKDLSTGKTMEKDRETSEVKSVDVDTSTADPQPVSKKAEAGQETRPNSQADSKQDVETAQADVLDTTKAASAHDNGAKVQKELTENVEPEAVLKSEVNEMKSEEKKVNSKLEDDRETVKPEKGDSAKVGEAETTKGDVPKTAAKETEIKTSEKKEIQTQDMVDSAKREESMQSKKTEKEVDQMQVKERDGEMETKSEEQSKTKADGTKTEENKTNSSKIQKEDIQKEPESTESTEKDRKYEQKPEKQGSIETSEDIKDMGIIKPKEQDVDKKAAKDVQPEQSVLKTSPEKEQNKEQKNIDKDVHEIKETKTEKSDKSDSSDAKQGIKVDTTKSKDLEKEPPPLQVSPEKGQNNSMKADVKKERDVPAVTENGVNM